MSNQLPCIRADLNLDLHLKFSANAPDNNPHIIHKTAGEKTDSVAATLVDVICTILAYQCPWSLVHLLNCSVEESYVVFNDLTSKKRWHYGYKILDDGQWILTAPGGFATETLVKHLIENEWLGNNAGFVRERDRRFEKPRLQIDAWLKHLERGIIDTLDPSKETKIGLLDETILSFLRLMARMSIIGLLRIVGLFCGGEQT
ncbi:hypothetical protein BELL_0605g00080 [Botrytis elliptica]|uniref:Uncharacterized protein n=1 Tax=Botrytis elliptica TaxID=278938 RepID=A0A4Z1JBX5_9HELO|nr:hypothetical protein BELL_0605g00080 [Botrytis elliptica]